MNTTITAMPLAELLERWIPGSRGSTWSWQQEYDQLWFESEFTLNTHVLATSISESGMQQPILLGNDGRVWDGHHRVVIAMDLGLDEVPVEIVTDPPEVEPS